ncbi:MAG: hypothetical protein JSW11_13765, partial [Candidatus Heimdallarchaeota archaeon]
EEDFKVEFTIKYYDNVTDSDYFDKASIGNLWNLHYQIPIEKLEKYLETTVVIVVKAIATVEYNSSENLRQYDIISQVTFNLTVKDLTPPRVKKELTRYKLDDPSNPTEIAFYTGILEYGSDITDVSIYYYFREASNETTQSLAGLGSSISQEEAELYRKASMVYHNTTTDGVPIYKVTVPFDHNGTSRDILYYIVTTDSAGNSGIAYDILDDPDRISETRFNYISAGIEPTFVLLIVGITIFVAIFGSVVYVKFIRKPELVGLDKELVLDKIADISEAEVMASLDSHTIGVVVSFFDQRHGPIPIIVIPEILKDNFSKLVDLSDRSFSGTGFCDDFDTEIPSSYDFVLARGLRTSVLSFGYALERPTARGGQENLTCNILVHQELFPLVESFKEEIKGKIHAIHKLMDNEDSDKNKIRSKVFKLRQLVSSIVLSYEKIYGTTELITEEN